MSKGWGQFDPDPLQEAEVKKCAANLGDPHKILGKNISYLIEKYGVKVNDFSYHYRYLKLEPKGLYNIKKGKRFNTGSLYVCIIANFFNEAFGAGLSFTDMYTDLEQRDAFNNLTNK